MKKSICMTIFLTFIMTVCSATIAFAEDDAVARIGTNTYQTLESAVTAAKDGDTIYLLRDVTVEEPVIINKSIIIDGCYEEVYDGVTYVYTHQIWGNGKSTLYIEGNAGVTLNYVSVASGNFLLMDTAEEAENTPAPEDEATIVIGDGKVTLTLNESEVSGGGVDQKYIEMWRFRAKSIVVLGNTTERAKININHSKLFPFNSGGTGIVAHRPVDVKVYGQSQNLGDSFVGNNFMWFKKGSAGSQVTLESTGIWGDGRPDNKVDQGYYGMFVFEENNVSINVRDTYCVLDHTTLFYWMDDTISGCSVIVDKTSEIESDTALEVNYNSHKNPVLMFGTAYEDRNGTSLLIPKNMCGHIEYKDDVCTSCGNSKVAGVLGDVTGEGVVDTSDAQAIFNHFMGNTPLAESVLEFADINGDGAVDTSDAQAVFNMFMGAA